jgi:hypothetical protein
MHRTLQTGLILLLIIPGLAILSACAKKTTTVREESKIETETADLERQRELEAERQRKEAEQRRYRAAKRQFTYEDIYFQKGSYRLQPEARTILYRKADFLKKYPDVSVIIEGHTNERGSRETNIAFGDRRRQGSSHRGQLRQGTPRRYRPDRKGPCKKQTGAFCSSEIAPPRPPLWKLDGRG